MRKKILRRISGLLICFSVVFCLPFAVFGQKPPQNAPDQSVAQPQAKQNAGPLLPFVIRANELPAINYFSLDQFRLYRSDEKGQAEPIPFQIDELNEIEDYILDQGSNPNQVHSNRVFDGLDELVFMGEDAGPRIKPTKFASNPDLLYELGLEHPAYLDKAVYIGIHFRNAPPKSPKKYVVFDPVHGLIRTSRFEFQFNPENFLTFRKIQLMNGQKKGVKQDIIQSSSFGIKADLRYLPTFYFDQSNIQSELDAYKTGPVRSVVRINFFLKFLKMNFELGMYTELSVFNNGVKLPAVFHNPIDTQKRLNKGSGFFYGIQTSQKMKNFEVKSNLQQFSQKKTGFFDFFKSSSSPGTKEDFFVRLTDSQKMFHLNLGNKGLIRLEDKAVSLFTSQQGSKEFADHFNVDKAPVNLALYFDLLKFEKGEHLISFDLFFNEGSSQEERARFFSQNAWRFALQEVQGNYGS